MIKRCKNHLHIRNFAAALLIFAGLLMFVSYGASAAPGDVLINFYNNNTLNDGTVSYTLYSQPGLTIVSPGAPIAPSGKSFDGWYTARAGGTKWNFTSSTVPVGSALNLYAQWKDTAAPQTVTVNYYNAAQSGAFTLLRTETVSVNQSSPYYLTNAPTPSMPGGGAAFDYWCSGQDLNTAVNQISYDISKGPARSVDLYARYIRTIEFRYGSGDITNDNPHSQIEKISFTANKPGVVYAAPSNPGVLYKTETINGLSVKVRNNFNGWFTNAAATIPFAASGADQNTLQYNSAGTATVYAAYTGNNSQVKHTVTLSLSDDDDTIITLDVPTGSRIVLPSPYTQTVELMGWYSGEALFSQQYGKTGDFISNEIYREITITARYSCIVSYDLNGGGIGGSTFKNPTALNKGSHLGDPGIPTREPYPFKGWYIGDELITFENGYSTKLITSSVTLKAVYGDPESENVCRVTYDANGGAPVLDESRYVKTGTPFACHTAPTKDGYRLVGWYTENTNQRWDFDVDSPYTQELKLIARWQKIYTVSFPGFRDSAQSGEYLSQPAPPLKNDSSFIGWEYKNAETGANEIFDFTRPVSEQAFGSGDTVALTPKYEKLPAVTLVYDDGSGRVLSNQPVFSRGDEYYFIFPQNPVKQGSVFAGWFDASDIEYDSGTQITEDVRLTAKWAPAPIEVIFNPNTQGLENVTMYAVNGGKILPFAFLDDNGNPLKHGGNVIVSWHTQSDCSDVPVDFDAFTVTADTTLYAKWGAQKTVTITFLNPDGTEIKPKATLVVEYAGKILEKDAPAPDSKEFVFANKWLFNGRFCDLSQFRFTSDITLTAYGKYQVTMINSLTDMELGKIDADGGTAMYEPLTPVQNGYVFAGWYSDEALTKSWNFIGSEGSPDTVTEHMTLYAAWSDKKPPVIESVDDLTVLNGETGSVILNVKEGAGSIHGSQGDDDLKYTLTLSDGSALPPAISFDENTKTITFSPTADDASYTLKLTATDGSLYSTREFTVRSARQGKQILTIKKDSLVLATKAYDNNESAIVISLELQGMLEGDELMLGRDFTAYAIYGQSDAGSNISVTVTVTLLDGSVAADKYVIIEDSYKTTGTINKAGGLQASNTPDNIVAAHGESVSGSWDLKTIKYVHTVYDISALQIFEYKIIQKPDYLTVNIAGGVLTYSGTVPAGAASDEIEISVVSNNFTDISIIIKININGTSPGGNGGGSGENGGGGENGGVTNPDGTRIPITFSAKINNKYYDGSYSGTATVTFDGLTPGDTLVQGVDYRVSIEFSDRNAGQNIPVRVTVTLNNTAKAKRYAIVGSSTFNTYATIQKSTGLYASNIDPLIVPTGVYYTASYDLTNIILSGSSIYDYDNHVTFTPENLTGYPILAELPTVTGNIMTYTANNAPNSGLECTLRIRVSSRNYIDIYVTIIFRTGVDYSEDIYYSIYYPELIKSPVSPVFPSVQAPPPVDISWSTETTEEVPFISGYPDGTLRPDAPITRAELAQMLYNLHGGGAIVDTSPLLDFTDADPEEWYANSLSWAVMNKYLIGYDDGTIKPEAFLSRAEMSVILGRVSKDFDLFYGRDIKGDYNFSDTEGHWCRDLVKLLSDYGVTYHMGLDNGRFYPNQQVTRADTITALSVMEGRSGEFNSEQQYKDISKDNWLYTIFMNAANGFM